VDTTEFERLKADFLKARVEKWAAIASSIGAAIAYLLLLVLLYLFVDLLVWRGLVASYSQLTPTKQKEFADEWGRHSDEERAAAVGRLGLPDPLAKSVASADKVPDEAAKLTKGTTTTRAPTLTEWELRWQAGIYLALQARAGQAAADAYLPEKADTSAEQPRLGVLSLVARERNRWTGGVLGWIASWNGWMWRPGEDHSANLTYLTGLFVFAFTIALVRGILVNAIAYLAAVVTLDFTTRLRRAIYIHTSRLGSLAIRTAGPDEPAQLFTKQTEAVGAAVHASLTTAYRSPILVFGLLILILLVNFWLAVSFLLLAGLVWLIGGQIAAHYRREARLGSRQVESTLALLVETLGLVRLVKFFQMERFNQNRIERQLSESGRAAWWKFRGEALAGPLLGSVALLAAVALLYLAARSVLAGEFTVAGLVIITVSLVSIGPPIAAWFDSRRKLRRGREGADAIGEFFARKSDAAEAADAEYLPILTSRIEFRNISLKEPGTERNLLENVSFAVPARTRVAIVGPDLTEKRSLLYLIPRFLDPTSGEIRIEDKNIRWVTHESLRAQVTVVMQDDLIFTDTVANNIGCGDQQYNLPQIIEAAKLAHAHQFIEKLPYGYETVVGDLGHSLKLGEKFRLALARAILRDPSILLIEEPSGPIDDDTWALLDDTLERVSYGRTIIFLANRLSTLRAVHRVFLLRDGRLEASGSHRDLWQHNEYYRRLQIVADATVEATAARSD
jgi:ABC-type multidrug transport system fused ATPase/permease subunit